MTRLRTRFVAAVIATALCTGSAWAAGPYPPYPQSTPRYYAPPVVVDPTPPPLSPLIRTIYAPFYAAGLVVRYSVYYLLVAPFEVFGRTVAYGVEGGVDHQAPPPPPPAQANPP
jgi:hypothetical protein